MERTVERVYFPEYTLPKPKRVAAYARVSTGKDAMLHSLSAQVSYYSQLIQENPGWIYAGVYADEAMTGTKQDREQFQRLMHDCRAGRIDMVITKSISRFSRNTITLLENTRELKSLGVDVFFEEQNIHTMSGDGELMLTILASYAQEESLSASENQKWRIRKCFENGEIINLRFMFGYNIRKGIITVNPVEAKIVREIFQRFVAGETLGSIAADLNTRKITGRFNGEWKAKRIKDIVSNEKYLGHALLQKRYRNNHLDKKLIPNRGELPQYYAEETHEAIVDEDLFANAQARLTQMALEAQSRVPPQQTPFTGKIPCRQCGKHYKRGKNHGHHFWNCSTYLAKGKAACQCSRIREDMLYDICIEVLGLDVFDEDAFLSEITVIRAEKDHALTFFLCNGEQIVKRWQHRSRTGSWTPQMREAARQRTTKGHSA